MMDIAGPDPKRPRLTGVPPQGHEQRWPNSETSRQLPPPAAHPYPHSSPFSRPPEPQHHIERRPPNHVEHQQYEQHPRPTSGPSHGYHHPPPSFGAPQREPPMVKRSDSDEPPQHYRPPSTGTPTEKIPPSVLHEGSRPPYPPLYNHHSQEHPPYRPPPASFPPPPSPMSASDPYHQQAHFGSQPQTSREVFSSVSYPSANSNSQNSKRPKAQRAAQACDMCRQLKGKCDEGRPICSSCREKGVECRYRDPPPKQQDKATGEIVDSITALTNIVMGMREEMVAIRNKTDELYARFPDGLGVQQHAPPEMTMKQEPREPVAQSVESPYIKRMVEPQAPTQNPTLTTDSPYVSTPGYPPRPVEPREPPTAEPTEESEEESGDPGPAKPPSIPVNHTTGAARLLLVPVISQMCHGIMKNVKIKNEKYPMNQEEKRGLLRLYGRGEGLDAPPGYDRDPLVDHGSDSIFGDTNSDVSSPAGEEWGQIGGLTPPGNPPPEFTRGSINFEGMPDLSKDTVHSLVQSYKDNINNMHPILVHSRLDMLVENFLRTTPESHAKPKQLQAIVMGLQNRQTAGFSDSTRNPDSPGNKRKRSPALQEHPELPTYYDIKPGHPFRSISSALVLLVLALGAVTQHKEKLPDCVPDKDGNNSWTASPIVRNGHPPSPMQNSPSISTPLGAPSPQDPDRLQPRSRRTSIEGAYRGITGARAKNLDIIPGLFYFALASDIIGNQLGGNSLQHVHVNILAGLYHGQLGRVLESHAYIHQACRALQVILRPKLDRFKKIKYGQEGGVVPAKDNPLVIAFWTCLQLESDIVAELHCPHSGILTHEEDMPIPNFTAAADVDGFGPLVVESYGAQLFLRKHLNQLHNMFYKPENDTQVQELKRFPTIEACEASLENIPIWAPNMRWNDGDPPASDILGARLRAKFYGAQVITYRHFVLKILDYSASKEKNFPIDTVNTEFVDGIRVPNISRDVSSAEGIDSRVLDYARLCIKALIRSTTAFHGLGDIGRHRPIVTNIWGTAHAQWGNLLVLQAAYKDPILKQFVDVAILKDLLEKTISFLKLVAKPSSALYTDLRILQHTGGELGLLHLERPNVYSSFSSTATGETPVSAH